MGAWIVVLIVLSLMGSVFWIMPSTRDKQRMGLRQRAMHNGLKVRLPDRTLKERLIRYEELILGTVMYESLNFSSKAVKFPGSLYVLKGADASWAFIDASVPLGVDTSVVLEAAASLPESCQLLVLSSNSVLVFWDERGENKDVDLIQLALTQINESMS